MNEREGGRSRPLDFPAAVGPPTSKSDLLARQKAGRAEWESLIASVPGDRIAEPSVSGKLSVKDVVAHLAAWERHATERLHARARGDAPADLGTDWMTYEHAFNERTYQQWHDRVWDDVRAEATASYADFLAAAEATPEPIFFAAARPAWQTVAFNGYLHYLDFADDIRAWLDRTR